MSQTTINLFEGNNGEALIEQHNKNLAFALLGMKDISLAYDALYVKNLGLFAIPIPFKNSQFTVVTGAGTYTIDAKSRLIGSNAIDIAKYDGTKRPIVDLSTYFTGITNDEINDLGALVAVWLVYVHVSDADSANEQLRRIEDYIIRKYGLSKYHEIRSVLQPYGLASQSAQTKCLLSMMYSATRYVREISSMVYPVCVVLCHMELACVAAIDGLWIFYPRYPFTAHIIKEVSLVIDLRTFIENEQPSGVRIHNRYCLYTEAPFLDVYNVLVWRIPYVYPALTCIGISFDAFKENFLLINSGKQLTNINFRALVKATKELLNNIESKWRESRNLIEKNIECLYAFACLGKFLGLSYITNLGAYKDPKIYDKQSTATLIKKIIDIADPKFATTTNPLNALAEVLSAPHLFFKVQGLIQSEYQAHDEEKEMLSEDDEDTLGTETKKKKTPTPSLSSVRISSPESVKKKKIESLGSGGEPKKLSESPKTLPITGPKTTGNPKAKPEENDEDITSWSDGE